MITLFSSLLQNNKSISDQNKNNPDDSQVIFSGISIIN